MVCFCAVTPNLLVAASFGAISRCCNFISSERFLFSVIGSIKYKYIFICLYPICFKRSVIRNVISELRLEVNELEAYRHRNLSPVPGDGPASKISLGQLAQHR